ncbi:hypothetical protein JTB14_022024 [Gonioctena quinquepunctata]|nr:hypothetical protein JTB14_022024 [Gonioctena quinquepunctata]
MDEYESIYNFKVFHKYLFHFLFRFVIKLTSEKKSDENITSVSGSSVISRVEMDCEDDRQSDMDRSSDESIDALTPSKKRISYKQKFTEKWLQSDPTMKEWPVKSKKQMMCLVCNKELSGGITHIKISC